MRFVGHPQHVEAPDRDRWTLSVAGLVDDLAAEQLDLQDGARARSTATTGSGRPRRGAGTSATPSRTSPTPTSSRSTTCSTASRALLNVCDAPFRVARRPHAARSARGPPPERGRGAGVVEGHLRPPSARCCSALDPATRVPWGLGMRPVVRDRPADGGLGARPRRARGRRHRRRRHRPPPARRLARLPRASLRLLGRRARAAAGRAPGRAHAPGGGDTWAFGPEDAPDRITGPAGQFCRVFVQRITRADAPDLVAEGEGADVALDVARAFL